MAPASQAIVRRAAGQGGRQRSVDLPVNVSAGVRVGSVKSTTAEIDAASRRNGRDQVAHFIFLCGSGRLRRTSLLLLLSAGTLAD